MSHDEIVKLVNSVFVEQFELNEADLSPEKKIFEDLELDSLDIVDLMIGLQGKFNIQLRQNPEIRQVRTLGDVYAFFEKMLTEHPELAEKLASLKK